MTFKSSNQKYNVNFNKIQKNRLTYNNLLKKNTNHYITVGKFNLISLSKIFKDLKQNNFKRNCLINEKSISFLTNKKYKSDLRRFSKKLDLVTATLEKKIKKKIKTTKKKIKRPSIYPFTFFRKTNNLQLFKFLYKNASFNRTSLLTSSMQTWGVLSIFGKVENDFIEEGLSLKLQLKGLNSLQYFLNLDDRIVKEFSLSHNSFLNYSTILSNILNSSRGVSIQNLVTREEANVLPKKFPCKKSLDSSNSSFFLNNLGSIKKYLIL